MACFHPIEAWKDKSGSITFVAGHGVGFSLQLACGQCKGCRVDRSIQWAVRCCHEAHTHEHNSYITLTYNEEHLPPGRGLVKKDFQDFMKRLRKIVPVGPRRCVSQFVRYYHCGEYGDQLGRPHYHALLFGVEFPDKKAFKRVRGNMLFTSDILSALWGKGFASIGSVTFQSAAYVARYIMKKQTGHGSERHYRYVDTETGEVHERIGEYITMSLKPGIGSAWFAAYHADVFPGDFVVMNGKKRKTPKFYDILFERANGEQAFKAIKDARIKATRSSAADRTPERLAVREKVLDSKLHLLKRDTHK